jgi:hypothetical protein
MTGRIPDGPWMVGQGEFDGRVIVVRANTGASTFAGDARYGHRVGVAVPLRSPSADGLPEPEESAELDDVEDKLVDALTDGGTATFVLAITTAGMREFVFYTSNPTSVESRLEQLSREIETHELQHVIEHDPEWDVFKQFAGSTRA